MRKILFILIAIYICAKPVTWEYPICNTDTIKLSFAPNIFAQTTIDGLEQNVLLTRFLHNKVGIYVHQGALCYFGLQDPAQISKNLGLVTLIFITLFVYGAIKRRYFPVLLIFASVPLMTFLRAPNEFIVALVILYKIFAIMGVAFLLKLR